MDSKCITFAFIYWLGKKEMNWEFGCFHNLLHEKRCETQWNRTNGIPCFHSHLIHLLVIKKLLENKTKARSFTFVCLLWVFFRIFNNIFFRLKWTKPLNSRYIAKHFKMKTSFYYLKCKQTAIASGVVSFIRTTIIKTVFHQIFTSSLKKINKNNFALQ